MAILGMLLMGVGGIISLIGSIMVLIEAFKTSVLWGLGSIFVPFVGLIFVAMNWPRAGRPFLISLGGTAIMVVGMILGGVGGS